MATSMRSSLPSSARARPSAARRSVKVHAAQVATTPLVTIKEYGTFTIKGSVRKVNEDRFDAKVTAPGDAGDPYVWAGVYDGHGGSAVAEWLSTKLFPQVEKAWNDRDPVGSITTAYLQADKRLLSSSSGFMGMGERGVGGSKCGATAATALIYKDKDSSSKLLIANVGDARVVLVRNGQPVQLTVDHVPDDESERKRIESYNPNPKMPLVRYIGGTWRVGGLLALSRAFGDAYLKSTLQFEGLAQGNADSQYSSGFGLVAEPNVVLETLTADDSWLVISSDGLYAEEERGGGGGLDNQSVADLCTAAGNVSCTKLAQTLGEAAIKLGSTDDVTVLVFKLSA